MKPKLTLRDLFWLVLMVALSLGWWIDRAHLVADYWKLANSSANSEMFQMDRTLNLEEAIEAEGYIVTWDETEMLPTLKSTTGWQEHELEESSRKKLEESLRRFGEKLRHPER